MKKILTIISVICVTFLSCKKDAKQGSTHDEHLYKVSFSTSGFTQQYSPFQLNSLHTTSADVIESPDTTATVRKLYYSVYDSNGILVHSIDQRAGQAGFGTINDNLVAGQYTVVFIGATDDTSATFNVNYVKSVFGRRNALRSAWLYYQTNGGVVTNVKESFYREVSLTVSGSNVNQSIKLNRIVGELQVNIEDAIASNAARITLGLDTSSYYFSIANSNPVLFLNHVTLTYPIPDSLKGTTGYNISYYMMNTIKPFRVTLSCYDNSNNVIAQKIISNVRCIDNRVTILTGNLFGGSGTTGAGIGVAADTTWSTNVINQSF